MGTDKNLLNINHLVAYYGSKGAMAQDLNITNTKLTGLLKNRRKFLMHLPELQDKTKLSYDELVQMILRDE